MPTPNSSASFMRRVHGLESDGLAELAVGVPFLDGFVFRWQLFNLRPRLASAGLGAEEFVEMQGLDGVMRFDAVPGGKVGKPAPAAASSGVYPRWRYAAATR